MGYDLFLSEDADKADFYNLRRPILEALYADGAYRGVGWGLELPAPSQQSPSAPALSGAGGVSAPEAELIRSVALACLGLQLVTLVAGAAALVWVLLLNQKRREAVSLRPWRLP